MSTFRSPTSEDKAASIPPKCVSCGKEISLFPQSKAADNVVILGDMVGVLDMGVPYDGMVCEACHKTWCASCWVGLLTTGHDMKALDTCTKCGAHLVPLTSKNLP